jgi:hypothetical protein
MPVVAAMMAHGMATLMIGLLITTKGMNAITTAIKLEQSWIAVSLAATIGGTTGGSPMDGPQSVSTRNPVADLDPETRITMTQIGGPLLRPVQVQATETGTGIIVMVNRDQQQQSWFLPAIQPVALNQRRCPPAQLTIMVQRHQQLPHLQLARN